jgi:hypothetical protein
MLLNLRDLLAIQQCQQIPKAGKANQQLEPCPAAE